MQIVWWNIPDKDLRIRHSITYIALFHTIRYILVLDFFLKHHVGY